jgi:flagellar biogenesis protein FliO
LDSFISGLQLIGAFIGVILVIFGAYWSTKWFSKRYNTLSNGKYIRVIERSMLSQDKLLALAKVKDKVYFIAVTGQGVETIDIFKAEEFPQTDDTEPLDFSAVLKSKIISQIPFIKQKGENEEDRKI